MVISCIHEVIWTQDQSQIEHSVPKNRGQNTAGSFILKPHSRLFITSISSPLNSNPSTSRFCVILSKFSDLGMTAHPLWIPHFSTAYKIYLFKCICQSSHYILPALVWHHAWQQCQSQSSPWWPPCHHNPEHHRTVHDQGVRMQWPGYPGTEHRTPVCHTAGTGAPQSRHNKSYWGVKHK